MIVKHGADQSLQGLSEVEIVFFGRDIPKLRSRFCGCVNLNGILYNQEHPLVNQRGSLVSFPPSESTRDLCVPFRLQIFLPCFCFFSFLVVSGLVQMDHVNIICNYEHLLV